MSNVPALRCVLATALLLSGVATVRAQPGAGTSATQDDLPKVADLGQRVDQALAPQRASTREVEIETDVPRGAPVIWRGRQMRKTISGANDVVTLLTDPPSVAGFAVLVTGPGNGHETVWMYVPPIRRVRRLVYAGRYENFLGTDLSASDFGTLQFGPMAKIAGHVQQEGKDTWEVEETPKEVPGGYSRIRTWIATDTNLPIRREYDDESGKLWKVATFEQVETVSGIPTPTVLTVRNVQEGGKTVLRYRDVRYDVPLDDKSFSTDGLASAGDAAAQAVARATQ